ncbi:NERD domain-containing protein [Lentibacillus sp. Marseille-P4043]|uniref:NERD domain-containing protein n=1 Tax=Lentibacillus sp. Marseille-P4043 TaxID=2040293 RepID=UPI000D0B123B|nr:NERD domain-containing protein [Lentibacillus sp. Marseille-P4043]
MIIRRRPKPLPLEKLEALIPRIPPHFKQLPELQQDVARRLKGYIGEKKVDHHLDQLAHRYTILHDVCLKTRNGKTFQIDTIVIAQHAIFLIDSKNYTGTITFDTILKQFTRDDGDKETGYRYPITQAENHYLQIENWLHDHHLPNVPIHFFIAIAEPSTVIKVIGDKQDIARVVMHGDHVPMKLMEMDAEYARNNSARLPSRKIGEGILRECQEFDVDILSQYGIKKQDIKPGVRCPSCGQLGMRRIYGKWKCDYCKKTFKKANLNALSDYRLLIEPWITNQECRRFLNLNSRSVATRILKASNLIYQKEHNRWIKR